jgi:Flp pilus assembly protein TadB
MTQQRLSGPLYESLPALYGVAGIAGIVAGYLVRESTLLSTLLSSAGMIGLLAGLVVWLRRRDYRRLREEYRVRGLDKDLKDD